MAIFAIEEVHKLGNLNVVGIAIVKFHWDMSSGNRNKSCIIVFTFYWQPGFIQVIVVISKTVEFHKFGNSNQNIL